LIVEYLTKYYISTPAEKNKKKHKNSEIKEITIWFFERKSRILRSV